MYTIDIEAGCCAMVRRENKETVGAVAEGVGEPG
jgi:hypothetical protein